MRLNMIFGIIMGLIIGVPLGCILTILQLEMDKGRRAIDVIREILVDIRGEING